MVDREARDKLAELIGRALLGQPVADQLRELALVPSRDLGAAEIWEAAVCLLGREEAERAVALRRRQRAMLERCALFLTTDLSYDYPTDLRDDYPSDWRDDYLSNPLLTRRSCIVVPVAALLVAAFGLFVGDADTPAQRAMLIAAILSVGLASAYVLRRWNERAKGIDRGLWPFYRRADYERARARADRQN